MSDVCIFVHFFTFQVHFLVFNISTEDIHAAYKLLSRFDAVGWIPVRPASL